MTEAALLCVYYKVDATEHAVVAVRVRQFQAALSAARPGLRCELLQRPEATAGIETWMETYRLVGGHAQAEGLGAALIHHIAQAAANAGLPTPRHSERFVGLR